MACFLISVLTYEKTQEIVLQVLEIGCKPVLLPFEIGISKSPIFGSVWFLHVYYLIPHSN